MFKEHRHKEEKHSAGAPQVVHRPKWMSEAVVDPLWVKEHGAAPPTTPDPLDLQWQAQKNHLEWCFDPALFKNGKGDVTWRPDPKNPSVDNPARTVQEAVREFMHSFYEIIEAKKPKQKDLEAVMWEEIPTLMRKLLQAAREALDNAHDELDETLFVRGVFERWIRDYEVTSDITGEELMAAGLDGMDQQEVERFLDEQKRAGAL